MKIDPVAQTSDPTAARWMESTMTRHEATMVTGSLAGSMGPIFFVS
jgi:hypothetical protein